MALSVVFRSTPSDLAAATKTPQSAGNRLNNQFSEDVIVSKLTGDTSGTITTNSILYPTSITAMVLKDNAGADQSTLSLQNISFTINSPGNITVTGLGNWTRALLQVSGARFK
jgi:hypothetical protein